MTRPLVTLALLAALAACGADGEPVKPVVGGSVTLSNPGVSIGTGVGFYRGPFSVGLGLGL